MYETINQDLLSFIKDSPTCFHAVDKIRNILLKEGYTELTESSLWQLKKGGRYFTLRNQSSVIAFRLPETEISGFMIAASHSDSPSFKVKENPEMTVENAYVKLNVEKYGGMICAPWLDRPLSVAGRVIVKNRDRFETRLVNVDRDLVLIPNLAIHYDREVNDGHKYNPQVDMLPLFGEMSAKGKFMDVIAEAAGVDRNSIRGNDLFLYSRTPASIWGAAGEYISSGRIDDLQCSYANLRGFLDAKQNGSGSVPVYAVFDNEEVGSGTKQGAASTFLRDVLLRIGEAAGFTHERFTVTVSNSFMVSADNGHAVHPNFADKSDPVNRPHMNQGIIVKYNANQKYTTDSVSAALFKEICTMADVPYQEFTNRSDLAGGSTLGNISNSKVSLNTVDIGLAQLAMHSPYETAGAADTAYLARAMKVFFSLALKDEGNGCFCFKK